MGYEPESQMATQEMLDRGFLGVSAPNEIASYDPTMLRSVFARFDPRLSHLANLNASNASPEIGALTMAQILSEEEKARLPMSTFFPR